MARKPDSNNVRRLKGEKNKDRYRLEANLECLTEIPEAPEFLTAKGVNKFNELCAYLISHNIATNLDIDHIALTVDLWVQITQMREIGQNPPMSMYTTWKSFSSDLYLNPLARQKMMGVAEQKKENKFASKPKPK